MIKTLIAVVIAAAGLGLLSCPTARGEEGPTPGWSGQFDYTAEAFRNVDGGIEEGTAVAGLANLMLDYTGDGWSAHANVYGPHGRSFTDRYLGDFSVASNIDTVHQLRLQELWLQRDFDGSSLRVGMLASDTEFWGSSFGGLFVNSVFGAPSIVSGNLPNPPIFPTAAFGVRYAMDFGGGRSLRLSVQDGDAGDPLTENRHGVDVRLGGGVLALAEFEVAGGESDGDALQDDIRISAYLHTGDFIDSHGNSGRHSFGMLGVVDHALSERVGVFVRAGAARRNTSLVPFSVETGVNVLHPFDGPGTLGLALAYVDLNGDLDGIDGPEHLTRELVLEATYDWPLGDHVTLQPDLQYIVDPGGLRSAANAWAGGIRLKVSLDTK